jgi:hypothetical protein
MQNTVTYPIRTPLHTTAETVLWDRIYNLHSTWTNRSQDVTLKYDSSMTSPAAMHSSCLRFSKSYFSGNFLPPYNNNQILWVLVVVCRQSQWNVLIPYTRCPTICPNEPISHNSLKSTMKQSHIQKKAIIILNG